MGTGLVPLRTRTRGWALENTTMNILGGERGEHLSNKQLLNEG
jgi:hypothetical protein